MQRFLLGPAVPPHVSDSDIRAGLRDGKLHLLQLVAAHLTGERGWLEEEDRARLEARLLEALAAYRTSGRAAPSPECSPLFEDLVAHAGRELADEAMPAARRLPSREAMDFLLDEMRGYPGEDYADLPPAARQAFRVAICGAGICGLALAIRLKLAGIPFVLLEKSDGLSGTWHHNRYPNVGCDTPSHMYSFSFDPNPNWEKYFATGEENNRYFNRLADKYGIVPFVRFGHEVTTAQFDEESGSWHVNYRTSGGVEGHFTANVYVSCVGMLSIPHIPQMLGQREFQGRQFHTARWQQDFDFVGKNVAIIGTGASCMQVSPWLAKVAKHLTVFQGTPQWFVNIPNYKRKIPEGERWCFAHLPFYERWYRFSLLRHLTDVYEESLESGSEVNEQMRRDLTAYYQEQAAGDESLLAKALPSYPPVCTRLLVDNGWFDLLRRDNVTLVSSHAKQLSGSTVVAQDGSEAKDVDVVVYATGFKSQQFCLPAMRVLGRAGLSLEHYWGASTPSAYLGVAVPHFPNFFMTYGPNTNVGSGGSIVWVAENQARYITQCCAGMIRKGLQAMEVKQAVFDEYNAVVDAKLAGTAWADTGCTSWYKVGKAGRVVNNSPWSLEAYCARVRALDLDDYTTCRQATPAQDGARREVAAEHAVGGA